MFDNLEESEMNEYLTKIEGFWNLVAGFNWEINRHLSWAVEYNGFTGSREQWGTSFNVRF